MVYINSYIIHLKYYLEHMIEEKILSFYRHRNFAATPVNYSYKFNFTYHKQPIILTFIK